MLIAVAFRNLIELSGSEFDFADIPVLPQSFGWSRHGNIVWRIFSVGGSFALVEAINFPIDCDSQ